MQEPRWGGGGGMQEPRWADLSKMADGTDEGQAYFLAYVAVK